MAYPGNGYPLLYSHEVFQRGPGRSPKPENIADCADTTKWLCIAIVRSPLDRAISSYIHSMVHYSAIGASFRELGGRANASFAEFAKALDHRAHSRARSLNDAHFMPQYEVASGSGGMAIHPHVLHVPIEMLDEPDGYSCPLLERVHGARVVELETAAKDRYGEKSAVMGSHYVSHSRSSAIGSEHWPWSRVEDAAREHTAPPYDSFWGNKTFCVHVVGCLFRADLAMYVAACTQPELLRCAAYRRACETQLERLRSVCGLDI